MILNGREIKQSYDKNLYVHCEFNTKYFIPVNMILEEIETGDYYEFIVDERDLQKWSDLSYTVLKISEYRIVKAQHSMIKKTDESPKKEKSVSDHKNNHNKNDAEKITRNQVKLHDLSLSSLVEKWSIVLSVISLVISIICFIVFGVTGSYEHISYTGPRGGTGHITSGGNISYSTPSTNAYGPRNPGSTVALIIACVFAGLAVVCILFWLLIKKVNRNLWIENRKMSLQNRQCKKAGCNSIVNSTSEKQKYCISHRSTRRENTMRKASMKNKLP